MFQPAKSSTKLLRFFLAVGRVLSMAAAIITAAVLIVPVGAGALAAWAVGIIFDALRPENV